jgi:hypothetical protein
MNVQIKTLGDLEELFISLGNMAAGLGLNVPSVAGDTTQGLTWFFRNRGSYQDNPFKLLIEELETQITPTMYREKMILQKLEYYKGMWNLFNE